MEKWAFLTMLSVIAIIAIYGISQYGQIQKADTSLENQAEIKNNTVILITQVNKSLDAARIEERHALEDRHHEHQQIIDNLTHIIKSLNLTVVIHDNDSNDTSNDKSGKISAFIGQPVEILNSTQ